MIEYVLDLPLNIALVFELTIEAGHEALKIGELAQEAKREGSFALQVKQPSMLNRYLHNQFAIGVSEIAFTTCAFEMIIAFFNGFHSGNSVVDITPEYRLERDEVRVIN